MAKFTHRTTTQSARIADLPWGQMTQFVTRLNNAGLTGDHVKKLLDNPELLTKVAEATKALLAEPTWDSTTGLHYFPTQYWNEVAPSVQMKRPESHCSCCEDVDHILVRVKDESCPCGDHWKDTALVHLSDSWVDIAPGVQARKSHVDGIAVRKLKTL